MVSARPILLLEISLFVVVVKCFSSMWSAVVIAGSVMRRGVARGGGCWGIILASLPQLQILVAVSCLHLWRLWLGVFAGSCSHEVLEDDTCIAVTLRARFGTPNESYDTRGL